ncbi:MAG: hypothetical protein IT495_19175 [Gammaproteobacteria bacterium]|nr:hypothetical protein [Gammaproteobacteria bacterium]
MIDHRVSIIYRARAGARFDWAYYLERHLPLAVGVSMRHASITACDVDRPLADIAAPHVCICVVHFADVAAMDAFRGFFHTGHPESHRILADEPNYTTIEPVFVAGAARTVTHGGDAPPAPGAFRLRLMFPAPAGTQFDHGYFAAIAETVLRERLLPLVPVLCTQTDGMLSGVAPQSTPAYHAIWSLYLPSRAAVDTCLGLLHGPAGVAIRADLGRVTTVAPEILAAEVVAFDLRLAAAASR